MTGTRRSVTARLGCWILLIVALLVFVVAGYKVVRIWPHASALLARAWEVRALASADPASLVHPQRLPWAREQLGATRDDLRAIRSEIRFLFPLLERLDWIPRFGGDIAAAPALLDLGIGLCDAGSWGLLGVEPVWNALSSADSPAGRSALEAALPALAAAQPRFEAAAEAVARARPAMLGLQRHELSPRVAHYVARFGSYWPALEGAVLLAQDLPALLGQSHPMSYLILAQNNQELRPTGGFISGVGLIQISAGKIISTTFEDSYAVDALSDLTLHPPAPQPLREYMWAPALVFRDANWSPDLSSSAATASSIYRMCRGIDVDGVVVLDLEAVAVLLGALGPLQPEGYPEPVTGDTLLQYVNEYWTDPLQSVGITDKPMDWWLHRKDFMGDLLKAALQKVTSDPQSLELTSLGRAVLKAFQGKHLLVTMSDAQLGRGLAAAGWDGVLRDTVGDYLMVVDANVGFRKVNPYVQHSVDYRVGLVDDQEPQAQLTVRYTNRSSGPQECVAGSQRYGDSYLEMMQGCYWDYVRVYVPFGSRLLSLQGGDARAQVSAEAGKTVFSTLLAVAPGQTRELVFQYELPSLETSESRMEQGGASAASESEYSLVVQKQAGTAPVPYHVSVSRAGWRFSPSRSGVVESYGQQEVRFSLGADTPLAWVEANASSRRATAAAIALAGLGLLLIGLGLRIRMRSSA